MLYGNQFQMGGYAQYPITNLMAPNPHQGMYPYATNPHPGIPYGNSGMNVNPNPLQNPFSSTKLSFLVTLEFPNLSKLKNDPIQNHFAWPSIPTKYQPTFPNLMGKLGMTPQTISPHTIYGVSPIHFWITLLNCGYSLVLSLET